MRGRAGPRAAGGEAVDLGLQDKLVIVTGAAQGIGEALARGFAAEGCRLALMDYEPAALRRVAASVRDGGCEVREYVCDVREMSQVRSTADRIATDLGTPDVLVNNAAWTATVPFLDVTEEEFDRTLDTGLKGLFFLSQSVARQMARRRQGVILHLGSQLGVAAFAGRSAYGAMKGGVHHLTRVMALELGPHGIRVNAVAPCITETATRRNLLDDPNYVAWVKTMLPIGRWAQPGDVVGPALFLASDHAAMITGHILLVDGGWTIH